MELIGACLQGVADVSAEPAPQIGIQEFGDSAIVLGLRCWVPTARYFQTRYQINAAVYETLQTAGIKVPFPRRELRMLDDNPSAAGTRV